MSNIREVIKKFNKLKGSIINKVDMDIFKEIIIEERSKGINNMQSPDGSYYSKNDNGDKPFINSKKYQQVNSTTTNSELHIIPTLDIVTYHEIGNKNLPKRSTFGIYDSATKKIIEHVINKMNKVLRDFGG